MTRTTCPYCGVGCGVTVKEGVPGGDADHPANFGKLCVKGAALKLRFRGKSGVMHEAEVDDARVAKVVRQCQQLPGQELFQYTDEDGTRHGIGSSDVNDYLREASGGEFTAKDFRTWHGTVQALELTRLACEQNAADPEVRYSAKEILGAVARQLGNTPAVCRASYVHPLVPAAWREGRLRAARKPGGRGSERLLLGLLRRDARARAKTHDAAKALPGKRG